MSIVPTTRKMLAVKDPSNANAEIQFTELGEALGKSVTNISQAVSLVKAYTMGIAQGVSKIDWFEASGSRYNMGLVDGKGNPYPAYNALKLLSGNLGPTPTYVGWLRFNAPRDEYGFIFTNDKGRFGEKARPLHCRFLVLTSRLVESRVQSIAR